MVLSSTLVSFARLARKPDIKRPSTLETPRMETKKDDCSDEKPMPCAKSGKTVSTEKCAVTDRKDSICKITTIYSNKHKYLTSRDRQITVERNNNNIGKNNKKRNSTGKMTR